MPGDPIGRYQPNAAAQYAEQPDPENKYPMMVKEGPSRDVKVIGDDSEYSFDYVIEFSPVYEWKGQRFVGPLEFVPSWPQDLTPVEYVPVPVTPERVT